jgi:pyridoxine 5-phosphate synthase
MTTSSTPKLSVNVNKVATLRNSRGGQIPSVIDAVDVVLQAGAAGITVHPRADARHITSTDVRDIARVLAPRRGQIEFNIEGDPRPDLVALVLEVRPDQCTLVPVAPGEVTSQAGWPAETPIDRLSATVRQMQEAGVRVSLFVDPDEDAVRWAKRIGADRIELYTEPFARALAAGPDAAAQSFALYSAAARVATESGLGINAGHDLDLENLVLFRTLPQLAEVSIGHALISHALFVGLDRAVRDYVAAVAG